MPVTITITEDNVRDLQQKLAELVLGEYAPPPAAERQTGAEPPSATVLAATLTAEKEDKPAKKGRGAAKKAVEESVEASAESPSASSSSPAPSSQEELASQLQDAIDEAKEAEANAKPDATDDDVRSALTRYAAAYGMEFAQSDGPVILQDTFGGDVNKVRLIPASPENYAKAVTAIDKAVSTNPFSRPKKAA